ncbi:SIMPL domain-containing protein [Parvularcula lutaonensis]|uniref:SIMPL domain-containing protein n=1 Tax=Parvularcula lutaonensis TaxID=491923 RepID=A0ABV7MFQ8_9PROT|nr:SIMPL domain-containing protein [Parvularcula lutaonensis]GGY50494.1 hypothetical protein GCM10007148_19120 [Parvularcula lutaonensis]
MIRTLAAASAILATTAACTDDTIIQPVRELRSISVTGEGSVSAVPDLAILSFSVSSRAATAGDAFAAASRQMNSVLSAIKEEGVEARDRQTGQVSLSPVYGRDPERGFQDRTRIVAYEATNSLTVRLRDIESAGEVIDAAVRAGANGLDSFRLGFDDPKALQDQARIAAVQDARRKASDMADAAGAALGEVLTISTTGGGYRPQAPMMRMQADMAMEQAAPVIEAGEQDMRVTVSATFRLE